MHASVKTNINIFHVNRSLAELLRESSSLQRALEMQASMIQKRFTRFVPFDPLYVKGN